MQPWLSDPSRPLARGPQARAVRRCESSTSLRQLRVGEFSLADRVALVSGSRRGIGLEAALALAEAGARSVYCLDLPQEPGEDWLKVREFASRMGLGKFEYISGDVRDQEATWKVGETIGTREGRFDVCIASAGILGEDKSSLEVTNREFQDTVDVNLKGVLFTAQAAGRQMVRFGQGGSIILIASICGSVATEPTYCNVAYHTTKSGVLQLARSMACELGPKGVRVNTISPGFFRTKLNSSLDDRPDAAEHWAKSNPLGRFGRTHELRGVCAWLASDASSYCTGTDVFVSGGHQAW
ncbi:sorbose reductase sou1 [Lentinus tigrinus ALCF2SS1-7]|uniref:sorbose reductase sou1 n=1 Tax=Lentinus tigrinus ALCF2SS1-7 TaxID=1328758 RepID=UPI001165D402|nr:sorbose reductase sou1 [Lentinus tigrinus ALCF2SS1-7]